MSKPYFEAHASVVLALADLDGLSQVAILRDVLATVRKRLSETNPELSSLDSARKAKDRERKRLERERKRLEMARKVSGNGPEMAQGPVTPSLSPLDQGLSLVSPLPLFEADPRGNGTSTAREPAKRGTRVPEDWQPSPEMVASLGLSAEAAKRHRDAMVDHFRAKPGKDACKLDWGLTFRGWVRRDADFRRQEPRSGTRILQATPANAPWMQDDYNVVNK